MTGLPHDGFADELREVNRRLRAELDLVTAERASLAERLNRVTEGMNADRASRRAALNLMEDAVLAREAQRRENEERRRVEEELREANQRKDEFLATLAHELRNPLAPIRNGLNVLHLGHADRESVKRIHGMIERQVNHMVRLVDDLLEVSRITRGRVELRREDVDLASVLQSAVETTRPLVDAARHQLEVTLPKEALFLDADPVRLAQIFTNLLANAVKYTDAGGRIWVTGKRAGETVVVTVRDTGIGVPDALLPKIFDMFVQADRTHERSQGGLGIGLTLVRSLVEMHGGTVVAESAGEGRGATFTVTLPIEPSRAEEPMQTSPPDSLPPPALSRRILVVDDNADSAETLGLLLEVLGAEVRTVHDGPSALSAITDYQPSVVFLDIGMPGMDGFEVARRARKLPEGRAATLVALTGWGQEEDRRKSRDAGMKHHLVKPVDIAALEGVLAALPPYEEPPPPQPAAG